MFGNCPVSRVVLDMRDVSWDVPAQSVVVEIDSVEEIVHCGGECGID